jgi:membrane-bound serine protease (ClpP class)
LEYHYFTGNIAKGGPMLQMQDIAYFFLIASIWTSVLAISSPGTGLLELAACICVVITAVFAVWLNINLWAFGILVAAFIVFLIEIAKPMKGIFLLISVVLFSVGSIFLFRGSGGEFVIVSWPLAVLSSLGTTGFFWLVVRKVLQTQRRPVQMDPSSIIGQIGETQTEILVEGSVQVASELWSARSDTRIPAGSRVRVISREGLILTVEKES